MTGAMLRPTPDVETPADPPPRWIPRPAPCAAGAAGGRGRASRGHVRERRLRSAALAILRPWDALSGAREMTAALGDTLGTGFHSASPTPLNVDIGPHRRFDWADADLEALKRVRTAPRRDGQRRRAGGPGGSAAPIPASAAVSIRMISTSG